MAEPQFRRARQRRIEAERGWLRLLEEANPGRLKVAPVEAGAEGVAVELCDTPYYARGGEPAVGLRARIEFPEYYPSVPVEAFVWPVAAHPNVHPETGFVCLWESRHPGTSLVEALRQVQRVVTFRLMNLHADHLMQPETVGYQALSCSLLEAPREYHLEISAGAGPPRRRKRLG